MMYQTRLAAFIALMLYSVIGVDPVVGQAIPKSLQGGDPEATVKDRKNAWAVGLVGGVFEGTFMRFAEDIRKVMDDGDEMRVLPIVSRGTAANLEDLLYLRGVDVAVTQVDIFEYFRAERKDPNLDQRIQYLLRFPVAEVHLITPQRNHQHRAASRQARFNSSIPGARRALRASIMFQRLRRPGRADWAPLPAG